jgi:hypothetical protein
MASSSTRKQCANDGGCKQAAVTTCEGCSKAFCVKHFNDHRRLLDEEMNMIIDEHDHLKHTLNQRTTKLDTHPLIKELENWEKESIAKIQQRAQELRQELLESTAAHTGDLLKTLQQLSEQLKQCREQDDFIEIDLQLWKKTLDNLKTDLTSLSTICINRHNNVSLVQDISINLFVVMKEEFELVSDNGVRIEESGQVVIHDAPNNHIEVRGKNEYASGSHTIRLCIEETSDTWMLLGINSKLTSLQRLSYNSQSTYGWSSNNDIWSNGQKNRNNSNDVIEMKKNDIINLILDCDKQAIMMVNERTNKKHEMAVNIFHCPFPWQLHINLFEANSRVRILS